MVDSCVLIDLFTGDQKWAPWSLDTLDRCVNAGELLIINPIVYSEISLDFDSAGALDALLEELGIEIHEVPRTALFDAARAFVEYRQRGGAKTSPLPDFFIGAHAQFEEIPVITRDLRRFQTYFPDVELISP